MFNGVFVAFQSSQRCWAAERNGRVDRRKRDISCERFSLGGISRVEEQMKQGKIKCRKQGKGAQCDGMIPAEIIAATTALETTKMYSLGRRIRSADGDRWDGRVGVFLASFAGNTNLCRCRNMVQLSSLYYMSASG